MTQSKNPTAKSAPSRRTGQRPPSPKKKWQQLLPGGKLDQAGYSKEYHTGDWRNQIPVIDKKKCANCLTCVGYCPEDCIIAKDNQISHIDYKYCKGCGICAKECPQKAITMKQG